MASQLPPVASEVDTPMQPDFPQPHEWPPPFHMDQLLQLLSNATHQISHKNQEMLSFLSANSERSQDLSDSKVRPKSLSGLLNCFEMISSYDQWSEVHNALEIRTVLKNVAATWFIQQPRELTENWVIL